MKCTKLHVRYLSCWWIQKNLIACELKMFLLVRKPLTINTRASCARSVNQDTMGLFQSLHGDCIRVHALHWSKLRRASNWSTYFSTLIVPNLRMHHWLWCHWQKCWFSLDQVHDRRFVDACFMYTILLMCKSATYFTRPPTCATRYAVCLFVPAFNFTCSLPSHSARSTIYGRAVLAPPLPFVQTRLSYWWKM